MPIITWKYVTGPQHLHPIQLYDLIENEKDYELRFPNRNNKLAEKIL